MPSWSALVTFTVAAVILIVIPGPSVLFSIARSLAGGKRAGVVSVAGNTTGGAILITLVAFGLAAVIAASGLAFTVIKFAGVVYLVYLGVQSIRHRRAKAADMATGLRASLWKTYRQGLVVGATNPKSLGFFVALLPQLVDPDRGPAWVQILVFGAIFLVIAFVSDSAWALTAGHARDWFARSPRRIEAFSATGGVMMIALAGVLAFARRGSA